MGDVPRNNEKGMFDKFGDSVSNMFSSAKDTVVDNRLVRDTSAAATSAAGSVANTVSNISVSDMRDSVYTTLSHNTSILFLIILLALLAVIIGYIIYNIVTDSVLFQSKILIPGTEEPIFCNKLTKHEITQILENGNGNKRTYSFWIYIFKLTPNAGKYRHVAHITSADSDQLKIVNKSTPFIILDNASNKLHVRFAPKDDVLLTGTNMVDDNNYDSFMKSIERTSQLQTGFTVDYVPLQRWVHIAIVINDISGGSVSMYVDSLLREVYDKNNMPNLNVSKLNLDSNGTLVVGGNSATVDDMGGFEGLLSKFTMFNYDLNKNDIYKLYKEGPVNTFMTSLGIGAYGLRNPIYKLEATSVESVQ
jgi:hypothetical protein